MVTTTYSYNGKLVSSETFTDDEWEAKRQAMLKEPSLEEIDRLIKIREQKQGKKSSGVVLPFD
jgi:hypothetical protein